ncbi:MAG: glycosyltransferase family 39 protein [Desulfarculaceae bacterium]|nr:glycosyltransferase family 39 protein [Desulfarculaceae bacterium]MCF8072118.1 glycosyltransferase family 39 protein [Desulfarculaceae bacterium]MCF8100039.1 glycosyltransferase family 39 protein [Desulfarculaceae bacterium]
MAQRLSPKTTAWLIAGLVLLAAAVRALFFVYPTLDADQAVVGLMGMEIMQGHLPLMFWGQDYGGSLESMVAAGFFALFGVSRQSLYLSPTFMSFFYLWAVYLLGRDLWSRRAGLCALFIAALGPYYLIWHSVLPRAIYIDTLALGAWMMWLTLKALRRGPDSPRYAWLCAGFGLMAGFAIWCHMLAVYFILPCALLWWRRDPRLVIRPAFGLMVAGFFLGSLPLWVHNLLTDWSTFHFMFHPKPKEPFGQSVGFIWRYSLEVLIGARQFAGRSDGPLVLPWLAQAVSLLVGLAGMAALWVWGKSLLARLVRRDGGDGSEMLLLFTLTVALVFGAMGLSSSGTHRYLVPLYAVYPLLLAWAFDRLLARGAWAKGLAWAGLGAVALLLAAGVYQVSPLGDPKLAHRYESDMERAQRLTDFLASHHVTHAYVPEYWVAPVLTFDSEQRVVYVVSRKDRNPAFVRAMLRARRFAVIIRGAGESNRMADTLAALGARPRRKQVGDWSVFWDITPPPDVPRALSPVGWRVTASPTPRAAWRASDYNASLAWSTPKGQHPGQWLQVDLGRVEPHVCSLLLFNGMAENAPHRLVLRGSRDGEAWEKLADVDGLPVPFAWSGENLVALRWNNWQELRFAPRPLRYLRLEQAGERPNWHWSMREMMVGQAGAPRPQTEQAGAWLRARLGHDTRVWCGPALAAWLPEGMRPQPSRHQHPGWLPRALKAAWLLPSNKPLYVAAEAGRAPYAEAALLAAGWRLSREERHGYVLFRATPPQALAQGDAEEVALRADGQSLHTGLPQAVVISGVELLPPPGAVLSWAGLRLELANTNGEFAPAPTQGLWPPRLFWSGLLPMAARPAPARLDLARPVEAARLGLSRQGAPLPPDLRLKLYLKK